MRNGVPAQLGSGWQVRDLWHQRGVAEEVTTGNSEHGESQARTKPPAAAAAVQGIGKREALTKLDLHQTEEEKTATVPVTMATNLTRSP